MGKYLKQHQWKFLSTWHISLTNLLICMTRYDEDWMHHKTADRVCSQAKWTFLLESQSPSQVGFRTEMLRETLNQVTELSHVALVVKNPPRRMICFTLDSILGFMRQVLRAGAMGRPRGMGWRGRQEGGLGWGAHVNPWLIHVNVWQKPLQYCKVISLQRIKKKKKRTRLPMQETQSLGLIPGSGRPHGVGNGNPTPVFLTEKFHGQSWTRLSMHVPHTHTYTFETHQIPAHTVVSACLFVTLWIVAHQAPLSMEFSRQEDWSGLPFPSPEDLPNPGTEMRSPTLQADSFPSRSPGKPFCN